jgi:hypothetical protein
MQGSYSNCFFALLLLGYTSYKLPPILSIKLIDLDQSRGRRVAAAIVEVLLN